MRITLNELQISTVLVALGKEQEKAFHNNDSALMSDVMEVKRVILQAAKAG